MNNVESLLVFTGKKAAILLMAFVLCFMCVPAPAFAEVLGSDVSEEEALSIAENEYEVHLMEKYGTTDILKDTFEELSPLDEALTYSSRDTFTGTPQDVNVPAYAAAAGWEEQTWTSPGCHEWAVPYAGIDYKMEVWGASGGNWYGNAGGGGYSIGTKKNVSDGTKFYIAVGGAGNNDGNVSTRAPGGWNGGGDSGIANFRTNDGEDDGCMNPGSGGGATHIATKKHGDGQLRNYSSHQEQVLLVAGGGGGSSEWGERNYGGTGGGVNGVGARDGVAGGSQSSAGEGGGFGYGGTGGNASYYGSMSAVGCGGGGGGWYGGGARMNSNPAGGGSTSGDWVSHGGAGGSGHVGSVSNGSTSEGGGWGNGHVTISWQSVYYVKYHGNGSTSGTMAVDEFHMGVKSTLSANKFKKTGFTALGWATSKKHANNMKVDWELGASSKTFGATKPLQVIDLYMVWKPVEASGGFYQNADESDTTSEKVTFTYDQPGQHFQTTKAFKKTGYIQTGWSTKRQQNNTIDIKSTEWSSINGQPLKVDKQSNRGGTLLTPDAPNEMEDILDEEGKKIGEKIKDPPGERPINKWIRAHQSGFSFYATWEPKSYKLQFFHNGGANWDGQQMFERTVYYDHTWHNELTREATAEQEMNPNKRFLGYYSAASGGQQVYDEYGLAVNSEDWFLDGLWHRDIEQDTIFLYAHWG